MRYLRLYFDYLGQELQQAMANRGDFWTGFLAIVFYQALGLIFVSVIFLNVPQIRGWRFEEVLFILGFFHTTTGLFYMHFAWTLWFPERYIVERQLDTLLTRPVNPYFQVIVEGLGSSVQEILFVCARHTLNGSSKGDAPCRVDSPENRKYRVRDLLRRSHLRGTLYALSRLELLDYWDGVLGVTADGAHGFRSVSDRYLHQIHPIHLVDICGPHRVRGVLP